MENSPGKSVLEVCAFTIQTCLIAERVGATRVELCDNPIEGGTTPSYGTIKQVRERVSIQVYPIIRPRALNFLYDDDEWEIIKADILMCKELQCDGISIGIQERSGNLHLDRMKKVVDLAYPMGVTCNRVIDAVKDPFEALEQLISMGYERVLTSGTAATAPEGAHILHSMVNQAAGRIIIMPGAGVKSGNVAALRTSTGAREFHTSARKAMPNLVEFSNPAISDSGNFFVADEAELKAIVDILDQ